MSNSPTPRSLLRLALASALGFIVGAIAWVAVMIVAHRFAVTAQRSLFLGFGAFIVATALVIRAVVGAAPSTVRAPPVGPAFVDVLAALRAPEVAAKPPGTWLFVVLLVVSLAANAQGSTITRALGIAGVIFLHEAGHWAAMRVFGYRDTRIFFVPFFGGAATGVKDHATALQESIVLLAGPIPGVAIGAVMLLSGHAPKGSGAHELAVMFLAINGFNLLPLHPLDGARLLQRTALSRWPLIEAIGVAAMSLAMLAIAAKAGSWLLGFLAMLGVGQASRVLVEGRAAIRLRAVTSERPERIREGSDAYLRALYDEATHAPVAATNLATCLARMTLYHRSLLREPASFFVSFVAVAVQITGLVLVVVAIAASAPAASRLASAPAVDHAHETDVDSGRVAQEAAPQASPQSDRVRNRREGLVLVAVMGVFIFMVLPFVDRVRRGTVALKERIRYARTPTYEWVEPTSLADDEWRHLEAGVNELLDGGCAYVGVARVLALRGSNSVVAVMEDETTGGGVLVATLKNEQLVRHGVLAFTRLVDDARVTTTNFGKTLGFPSNPRNESYRFPRLTSARAVLEAHRLLAEQFRAGRPIRRLSKDAVIEDDLRSSRESRARYRDRGLHEPVSEEWEGLTTKGAFLATLNFMEPFVSWRAGAIQTRSERALREALVGAARRAAHAR
ncbi:MAG: site-2 protease family protein [Polyangiales bacterium]